MSVEDKPNWRNLVGMVGFLVFLLFYGLIVAEIATRLGNIPFLLEIVFYIVVGLAWLWPARSIVRWMLAGNQN